MRKLNNYLSIFSTALCGVLLSAIIYGCSKDDEPNNSNLNSNTEANTNGETSQESTNDVTARHKEIKELFASFPTPEDESTYKREGASTTEKLNTGDGIVICDCQEYEQSEKFNENMLLDPASSSIYPGSILDGNTIKNGGYKTVSLKRAPLTISTDFFNKEGNSSVCVENPTLSGVRDGIKSMLYDCEINGHTQANTTFEIKEVYSEEQLSLAIGTTANIGKRANIEAGFNFDKSSTKSHVLVKLIQVYYTVDMDEPPTIADFFDPSVSADDIKTALNGCTIPVYVSSVKYGRVAYFSVESSESAQTIKAALEAQYNAAIWNATLKTEFEQTLKSKETTISGTVVGGSGEQAAKAISGLDGMLEYIKSGGNFSKESPAAPIAFTLKSLKERNIFSVSNATKYTIRNCHASKASIQPVYFEYVSGPTDYMNIYGNFYLMYNGEKIGDFWVKDKNHMVKCKYGEKTKLSYNSMVSLSIDPENDLNKSLEVDFYVHGVYGEECSHEYFDYELFWGDHGSITVDQLLSGENSVKLKKDADGHYVFEMSGDWYKYKCPNKDANHNTNEHSDVIIRIGFDLKL
ncbi:MAG: thiol-activated cytolysin family protein [Bacteroidales bacterium]|nr:thiol-activated cytolysin family protein [Bacteroidales bacterium]